MFGVQRGKQSAAAVAAKDRICKEEGGHGYIYENIPGTGLQGWYTGPNRGAPFDGELAQRVLARVAREVEE